MQQVARRAHDRTTAAYDALGVGTCRTHAVQFYESDEYLISSVGDYLAGGLTLGQPVIAIATPGHCDGFRRYLRRRGVDVDVALLRGQLSLIDGYEMLGVIMDGPLPHPARCRDALVNVLRRHDTPATNAPHRVFGELVDILSRGGHMEGALRLEQLWNELARVYRFSLLCGYSLHSFADGVHGSHLELLCREHEHVIPTERYTQIDEDARLREIAILQQRALALETEVERRKNLERSLREALVRAEAANRTKNEFLAAMSHELRTPLNAIGGHVQLIEMELHGPVTEQQRAALDRVQRSQRHLLGLINNVLNLTRLESAHVEYEIEAVSIEPMLADVASLLSPLFAAGALTCTVEPFPDQEALLVLADADKLRQVLLNLLGNAVKFTPAGGKVRVRVTCADDPDGPVSIAVHDSGVGIPEHKLESIFEPFVQLGIEPGANREGVGLGLSISRTLARGMFGDLVAESRPGSGSVFTLTLPRG